MNCRTARATLESARRMRQDPHTKLRRQRILRYALALFILAFLPATAKANETRAPERADIGVSEHLGAALPLEVPFVDHQGHAARCQPISEMSEVVWPSMRRTSPPATSAKV